MAGEIDRIKAALAKQEQVAIDNGLTAEHGRKNHEHQVGFDEDDKPISGERTPLATVRAGDVVEVCKLVKEHDEITRALRKGARAVEPQRMVQQQCQDLHHLLDVVGD